jgi:Do/DeqQ family serine protease
MRTAFAAVVLSIALVGGLGHAETRVPQNQAEIALSFAPAVRTAAPAVVNIYARRFVQSRRSPFADDPFFGPLFRDFGSGQPHLQNSLGSGVILSPEGLVVSNYHVVGEAADIRVVLADRREYAADVLLADEESDLAVLRLREARDLPALALRDSDELEVGELVLAIGNPFGLGQTVTSGIVSGLARSGMATGSAQGWFIQTDAAINPGNSGGALVDTAGRLIGINTSILTRSGASHGIGFAIPSNLVARVAAAAEAGATAFARPWAGLAAQSVTAEIAEAMDLPVPGGLLVSDLHPDSPFARAGLRAGDVIRSVDGFAVHAPQDMMFRLSLAGPGGRVALDYLRDGRAGTTEVVLDAPPAPDETEVVTVPADLALGGLAVTDAAPGVLAALDLPPGTRGTVVLDPGRRGARIGLRRGDVILSINGAPIGSAADVARAAEEPTRTWVLVLDRQGRRVRLAARL